MLSFEEIKEYRQALGLNQKEIVEELGMAAVTYRDLERGKPCKAVYYLALEQYFYDRSLVKRMPHLIETISKVYKYDLTSFQKKVIFAIVVEHESINKDKRIVKVQHEPFIGSHTVIDVAPTLARVEV